MTMVLALAVISAALQSAAPEAAQAEAVPAAECAPGVYLLTQANGGERRLLTERTTSHRRMGNVLKGMLFGGVSNIENRAVVQGARAETRLTNRRPAFLFCDAVKPENAPAAGGGMGYVGGQRATRPANFRLVRFDVENDGRDYPLSTLSGKKSARYFFPFTVRNAGPGMREVTPIAELPPGEYGFVGLAKGSQFAFGDDAPKDRVIDFAIDVPAD
jgi:hypothetical protein